MADPDAFHASLERAIAAQGVDVSGGHRYALATNWGGPGTPVEAFFVVRVADRWQAGAAVAWHGGRPDVGIQVHGTWG